jgi:hypothetical protein
VIYSSGRAVLNRDGKHVSTSARSVAAHAQLAADGQQLAKVAHCTLAKVKIDLIFRLGHAHRSARSKHVLEGCAPRVAVCMACGVHKHLAENMP